MDSPGPSPFSASSSKLASEPTANMKSHEAKWKHD
jgi:hypothetical protein